MDELRSWWMVFLATLVALVTWGGVEKGGGAPVPDTCDPAIEVCEPAEEAYGSLDPSG